MMPSDYYEATSTCIERGVAPQKKSRMQMAAALIRDREEVCLPQGGAGESAAQKKAASMRTSDPEILLHREKGMMSGVVSDTTEFS
jgi:hypothetical protein